jgi:hypothetical protein
MRRFCLAILSVAVLAPPALAQVDTSGPLIYVPVDQTAEDIDPRQTSLRRMQAGLRADGEQTSVFKAVPVGGGQLDPFDQPRYVKVAPGYRALLPHMDYAVLVNPYPRRRLQPQDIGFNVDPVYDGLFVELIPSGTVFDLRPVEFNAARLVEDYDKLEPPAADDRMSTRSDLRIDARIDPRVDRNAADLTGWFTGQDVDNPYLRTLQEVKARQDRRRADRMAAAKRQAEIKAKPAKSEDAKPDTDEPNESAESAEAESPDEDDRDDEDTSTPALSDADEANADG